MIDDRLTVKEASKQLEELNKVFNDCCSSIEELNTTLVNMIEFMNKGHIDNHIDIKTNKDKRKNNKKQMDIFISNNYGKYCTKKRNNN